MHWILCIRKNLPLNNLVISTINTYLFSQSRAYRRHYCCVIPWKHNVALRKTINRDHVFYQRLSTSHREQKHLVKTKESMNKQEKHISGLFSHILDLSNFSSNSKVFCQSLGCTEYFRKIRPDKMDINISRQGRNLAPE